MKVLFWYDRIVNLIKGYIKKIIRNYFFFWDLYNNNLSYLKRFEFAITYCDNTKQIRVNKYKVLCNHHSIFKGMAIIILHKKYLVKLIRHIAIFWNNKSLR